MLGSPTILLPKLPRGDTECTLGCTSVAPVPDIAPTGFPINDDVLVCLLCNMLSTVFSMKTLLFLIVSALLGEFERVRFFLVASVPESKPPFALFLLSVNEPESPCLLPLPSCGTCD